MVTGLPPSVVAFVLLAVAAGGVVTGLNGFGFAVVGTSLLAVVLEPQTAVSLMILPILGANVSLVRELDAAGLRSCVRRFWPFVAAAAVGTVAGMSLLSVVPTRPLLVGLGLFVLGYVAVSQSVVALPGEAWLRDLCFSPGTAAKAGFGLVAGGVFGVSNVGVQVTAYLESLELDRSTFVGLVAMVFLGISSVRVVTATALGLYADAGGGTVLLSVAAVVPGLVGVAVGARLRRRLPEGPQRAATFLLLAVIGMRLAARGAGVV
jgi:hypothetical protein